MKSSSGGGDGGGKKAAGDAGKKRTLQIIDPGAVDGSKKRAVAIAPSGELIVQKEKVSRPRKTARPEPMAPERRFEGLPLPSRPAGSSSGRPASASLPRPAPSGTSLSSASASSSSSAAGGGGGGGGGRGPGPSSRPPSATGTAGVRPKRPTSGPSKGHGGRRHWNRSAFERELLNWDILASWEEDVRSSLPGGGGGGASGSASASDSSTSAAGAGAEAVDDGAATSVPPGGTNTTSPVPDTFESVEHYQDVWFPLLLEEMRAETMSEITAEGIGPVSMVTLVPHSPPADSLEMLKVFRFDPAPLHTANGRDRKKGLRECFTNDLVLLVRDPEPILDVIDRSRLQSKFSKGQQRRPLTTAGGLLALVNPQGRKAGQFLLRVNAVRWAHLKQDTMYGFYLRSLTGSVREVTAVLGVGKVPMVQRLFSGDRVSGAPEKANAPFTDLGEGFVNILRRKFNESQFGAIEAAATESGFTLIKGPPGTGKTTTLKGLLNSLHLREYQVFYKFVVKVALMEDRKVEEAWLRLKEDKPHLLVTAPSNVAVDNIILRIIEDGFIDGNGQRYNPSIVRVGRGQSERVKAVSLDQQVDDLMNDTDANVIQRLMIMRTERAVLQEELNLTRQRLRLLHLGVKHPLPRNWEARVDDTGRVKFMDHENKLASWEHPPPPEQEEGEVGTGGGWTVEEMPEYQMYCKQITSLVERIENYRLEEDRCQKRITNIPLYGADVVRQELETNILDTAHIVFTTLNSAGSQSLLQAAAFKVVVVDEAAQAIEPSTLIPLQSGAKSCVLVGDPQQLPATVFSQAGCGFERSLFERLETGGHPVHLLDTQYRMHPSISAFPRKHFYGSLLKDGANVSEASYTRSYHRHPALQPFTFLNLRSDTHSSGAGGSFRNPEEARLIVNLYHTLKREAPAEVPGRVGVITPYSAQLMELNNQFARALGPSYTNEVELNTVDGFQGKEKDIILISLVRAGGTKGIGFLADIRRMNVGLTRGKYAVLVVGREDTLSRNKHWRALLDHAKSTNAFIHVPDAGCNLLQLRPGQPPPVKTGGGGGGGRGGGGRGGGGRGGRGGGRQQQQQGGQAVAVGGGGRAPMLVPPRPPMAGRGLLMPPQPPSTAAPAPRPPPPPPPPSS